MRKYKTSKRGLTFSITPDEQYHPGSHYVYQLWQSTTSIGYNPVIPHGRG